MLWNTRCDDVYVSTDEYKIKKTVMKPLLIDQHFTGDFEPTVLQ
jgi:hypothetical protein